MGKKLIVKGADFSANGIGTALHTAPIYSNTKLDFGAMDLEEVPVVTGIKITDYDPFTLMYDVTAFGTVPSNQFLVSFWTDDNGSRVSPFGVISQVNKDTSGSIVEFRQGLNDNNYDSTSREKDSSGIDHLRVRVAIVRYGNKAKIYTKDERGNPLIPTYILGPEIILPKKELFDFEVTLQSVLDTRRNLSLGGREDGKNKATTGFVNSIYFYNEKFSDEELENWVNGVISL